MIRTENFNPIDDPKLLCTCGRPGCDKRSVNQDTLNKVQWIRENANRPLTVSSGGRCPLHLDEHKRTKPADHQNCVAVDIKVNGGVERMELVTLGLKHGATAIGVGKTFVHLGWRDTSLPVMWKY
jgi:uncharacterized protein YcbK (DUF882 family)